VFFTENNKIKVLVISHIAFSQNTNMSKTLSSYFKGFQTENIGQLYFYPEIPTVDNGVCKKFYRITDAQAIKSIFMRFNAGDPISCSEDSSKISQPSVSGLREYGRKRSPLIYLGRDMIWALSSWHTKKLKLWLDEFNPDIVFFASGDYAFSYRIAYKIAKKRKIPLVVSCMDDFYLFNMNSDTFLGRLRQKYFMHSVKQTMEYASGIVTLNTKMNDAYHDIFNKKTFVYHNSAVNFDDLKVIEKRNISYLGNISLGRYKQLIDIGKALKEIDPNLYINIYSSETDKNVLKEMTLKNGIKFCGSVSADEVGKIVKNSLLVIHTESFEDIFKERVRYSTSTKIPDCLLSGTCMLAYGPSDVASIEYLKENKAAFIIDDKENLKEKLIELLGNSELRENTIRNATKLAAKNHNSDINSHDFYLWMSQFIR